MHCTLCGVETPPGASLCSACAATRSSMEFSFDAPAEDAPLRPKDSVVGGFSPGSSFGPRYLIIEAIGGGGMGCVYKALDRQLGRTVALKLVRSDLAEREDTLRRFRQELALAQDVTHPNVCRVYDLGEVGGVPYISMEYVDGQSLADLICSMGRLSPHQTATLGRQICAGLQAIHEKSIIHRDLKPGNVMVDRSGQARIMDFGVAHRPGDEKLTKTGMVVGTMLYAAPEYLRGSQPDARCDVYSLGLLLFEMLTGKHAPGDQGTLPFSLRDRSEHCPPPSQFAPEVPEALNDVVLRCVDRDPAERYQSASELGQALAAFLEESTATFDTPIKRITTALFQPGRRASRLRWRVVALAAVALVAASLVLVYRAHFKSQAQSSLPASVAFLPWDYEGPADQKYLRNVIPLLLSENLRATSNASVVSFHTSSSFQSDSSVRIVGSQLGVSWVANGVLRVREKSHHMELRICDVSQPDVCRETKRRGRIESLMNDVDEFGDEILSRFGAKRLARALVPKGSALEYYLAGVAYLEGWDVEESLEHAEDSLTKAIGEDPDFAEAHAALSRTISNCFTETRNPVLLKRMRQYAERAVELKPTLPDAHLALGAVLLQTGDSAKALLVFERALDLAPADDSICRRIARAYASLGRHDAAIRMFDRAIELRPMYWQNYSAKGGFELKRGRLDQAMDLFKKTIEFHPEGDSGYNNLALVYIFRGSPDHAIPLLQTAIRIKPNSRARSNLGTAYYLSHRYSESAAEYRKLIDMGSELPAVHVGYADALRALRQSEASTRYYSSTLELAQEQLRLNDNDQDTRGYLLKSLAALGRCREASSIVEKRMSQKAVDPLIGINVAAALAMCGKTRMARAYANDASQKGFAGYVRLLPDLARISTNR